MKTELSDVVQKNTIIQDYSIFLRQVTAREAYYLSHPLQPAVHTKRQIPQQQRQQQPLAWINSYIPKVVRFPLVQQSSKIINSINSKQFYIFILFIQKIFILVSMYEGDQWWKH